MSRRALWSQFVALMAPDTFGRPSALPATIDELTDHALAFEIHWNRFVRTLAGCPERGETDEQTCHEPRLVDYAAFFKARSAAKKLFDLREPHERQAS